MGRNHLKLVKISESLLMEARYDYALHLMFDGNLEEAFEVLSGVLQITAQNSTLLLLHARATHALGLLEMLKGSFNTALPYFSQAEKLLAEFSRKKAA